MMKVSLEFDENMNLMYTLRKCGEAVKESKQMREVSFIMKKTALVAIGLGVAYLMRNEDSRKQVMKQIDSFTTGSESNQTA